MYSVYKYNALTEDEIVMAVSRLDKDDEVEDDELIAKSLPFLPTARWVHVCQLACSSLRYKPTAI